MSSLKKQEETLSSSDEEKLLKAFREYSATVSIDTIDGPVEVIKNEYANMVNKVAHEGELMLQILPYYSGLFDYLPSSLKQDNEFRMGAVKISTSYARNFYQIDNVDICKYVLDHTKRKRWDTRNVLMSFSKTVLENEDISKKLAKKFPMFINLCPKLCRDVKLVKIAIENDGRAIRHASRELLRNINNRHLILTAVKNSRKSLYYVLDCIDRSFAKHPILSNAAFMNFKKRWLCHIIPASIEVEMRKLFREEYSQAVKSKGNSYKDPLTHGKSGKALPKEYFEQEYVNFCNEEEQFFKSHFLYCHDNFFGHFSDLSITTTTTFE
ncbi:predicted protein [Naegleria gruberi]|uniref:Predicted protein n=1 Tax=Naegleria gruberi TaxID=5762 RepID=D2VI25_NAEGR|nr:uncharacterized protein NAEGRDRAFT_49720 [Naegleria gruberi]EFC43442.1 predicted protein [Naegleria gruberi]|eukprot:XP_002676186.1 predicted protein [Naegleria gruberi strain NEG-M]